MVPEAECLSAIVTVLGKLQIGDFYIKVMLVFSDSTSLTKHSQINHRCLLDEILLIAGVPNDKVRTISSSIDKLDKKPWSEVADEIVNVKGIDIKVAEKIKKYVLTKSKCKYFFNQIDI